MKIWFDIDDVLCDTARYICEKNNNIINWVPFTIEERTTYALSDNKKLGFKDYDESEGYYRSLFSDDWDLNVPTLKNAKNVIEELKNEGHKIYLITSRPLEYEHHTNLWLEKNFWLKSFKEIHFIARENTTKWRLCEELELDLFVEDYTWYCEEVAEKWIKVLMMDMPYNRSMKDLWRNIERIYNLDEIFDKIG